ncbi:MAG: hypothetical protein JWM88_2833 [Verrucomicrobia bacterium]|nr:hypothetical protein [Verrucomicrobiota bacterium]
MNSMKTLPVISALIALAILALVPTPAAAGSLLFALSLMTIFTADCARVIKPLTPQAKVVSFHRPVRIAQACEQAA